MGADSFALRLYSPVQNNFMLKNFVMCEHSFACYGKRSTWFDELNSSFRSFILRQNYLCFMLLKHEMGIDRSHSMEEYQVTNAERMDMIPRSCRNVRSHRGNKVCLTLTNLS